MSDASDILRERAQMSEERVAAYGICSPDELRAIADLLDALLISYGLVVPGDAAQCQLCTNLIHYPKGLTHKHGCAVEALERAITGESDAARE